MPEKNHSHSVNTTEPQQLANDTSDDLVWGMPAIAQVLNRTPAQGYYLHSRGQLKGCVRKVGHRTFVGSRKALRRLAEID